MNYTKQAYWILYVGFIVTPITAGIDKFLNLLVDWEIYLAPLFPSVLNLQGETFMYIVGGVEVLAGLIVFLKPKIGSLIVAAWLVAIILNLLLLGQYYDIALRDFGLLLGALALNRLSFSDTSS